MIIQTRQETLRFITQHDHGLLAGEIAHAWRRPSGAALSAPLVRAIALHDLAWGPIDDLAGATRMLDWYALRWKIETYHKVLKSGCRVEAARLQTAQR